MSQLIKQNSIPSGDFEEADEEELIPVKREPTRIEPEAGLPPSDDQLEFEECPQEGDDHPQRVSRHSIPFPSHFQRMRHRKRERVIK